MASAKLVLVAAACGLLALPFAGGPLRIAQAEAATPAQALPAPFEACEQAVLVARDVVAAGREIAVVGIRC